MAQTTDVRTIALIGPADAEDAVQEAAMRAWQAWTTLRNPDAAAH